MPVGIFTSVDTVDQALFDEVSLLPVSERELDVEDDDFGELVAPTYRVALLPDGLTAAT